MKYGIRVGPLGMVIFKPILEGSEKFIICYLGEDCSGQRDCGVGSFLIVHKLQGSWGKQRLGRGKAREGRRVGRNNQGGTVGHFKDKMLFYSFVFYLVCYASLFIDKI